MEYGIFENMDVAKLKECRFKIVLDKPYKQTMNVFKELNHIKSQYKASDKIVIGGYNRNNPNLLLLCAIDQVGEALTETTDLKNARKTKNNNYFYFVKDNSFGFTPD